MILPTLWIERQAPNGTDVHGQPYFKPTTRELVAPVKLAFDNQHTTVRTDSAASHGHAYEATASVVLLAMPKSRIEIEDILIVIGNKIKVTEKRPRYRVSGALDHYEIHCTAWK